MCCNSQLISGAWSRIMINITALKTWLIDEFSFVCVNSKCANFDIKKVIRNSGYINNFLQWRLNVRTMEFLLWNCFLDSLPGYQQPHGKLLPRNRINVNEIIWTCINKALQQTQNRMKLDSETNKLQDERTGEKWTEDRKRIHCQTNYELGTGHKEENQDM